MKVTIQIEAITEGDAIGAVQHAADMIAGNGRFPDGSYSVSGHLVRYAVRVERAPASTASIPTPSALDRIADSLVLIEKHLQPRNELAQPAMLIDEPIVQKGSRRAAAGTLANLLYHELGIDQVPSAIEKFVDERWSVIAPLLAAIHPAEPSPLRGSDRAIHNLRWIANIAYNMKQGVKISNLGAEAEFQRIYVMAQAIADELGVKL